MGTALVKAIGRPPSSETLAGLHRCTVCKNLKSLKEFYKDRHVADGYGHRCKLCNIAYKKQYHKTYTSKLRPHISVRRKAHYAANREKLLAAHKALALKNGHKWEATRRSKRALDPIPNMLAMAKKRATDKGLPFALTPTDIVLPEFCPVLGIKLEVGKGKATRCSPTLDRIDNSKGYTPDNTVVISFRANTIKNDATLEELRMLVAFYEKLS